MSVASMLRRLKNGCRRPIQLLLILTLCSTLFYLLLAVEHYQNEKLVHDHNRRNILVLDVIHDQILSVDQRCVRPSLQLWPNDDYKRLFKPPSPLKCEGLKARDVDWVRTESNGLGQTLFYIDDRMVSRHGNISCELQPIYRGKDDFKIVPGKAVLVENGSVLAYGVFEVQCIAADGKNYSNVHLAVNRNNTIVERSRLLSGNMPPNGLQMNIIIFGFDSVSHLTWLRNLPKTYQYLVDQLGSVVLDGYNVVGDGTTQALISLLTGYSERELPESRRGFKNAVTVDDFPWIWKKLQDIGYVTQWGEQSPHMGTFTYRLLGFREQPVDEYLRTYYLAAKKYEGHDPSCRGSLTSHGIMLRWVTDFLDAYIDRPIFSFAFHSEYTHGSNNRLQWADEDVLGFLKQLNSSGKLNNTMLFMMADHGARFQNVRASEQGKYEERLPFAAVRLPPWFAEKYPDAFNNLKQNSHRLTTPFDLHETFNSLITGDFKLKPSAAAHNGTHRRRAISLFDVIADDRTCADADIEPHWCACLKWNPIPNDSPDTLQAVAAVLSSINQLIKVRENDCATLTLGNVTSSYKYFSSDELLKFKRSSDTHGRIPDMTDKMAASLVYYQIMFSVRPSGGLFEATVKRTSTGDSSSFTYSVNVGDISRINKYGDQPSCVAAELPHLRPFCYCTTFINKI